MLNLGPGWSPGKVGLKPSTEDLMGLYGIIYMILLSWINF